MSQVVIRNGYALFWGAWPSNWEYSPFELDGVRYNCVEQYMMAEKARTFGDREALGQIMSASDPKKQKSIGRSVRGYVEERWAEVRYAIVLRGTIEKYRQNRRLRDLLLATKDSVREFVEASPTDTVWGVGLSKSDPGASDPSRWRGQNLLGRAITEAREALLREAEGPRKSDTPSDRP